MTHLAPDPVAAERPLTAEGRRRRHAPSRVTRPWPRRRLVAGALLVVAGVASWARPALGQSLRGDATTTFRYIELRPMVRDTVDRSRVSEGQDGELTFEGHPVTCDDAGSCTFLHSPSTESAMTLTQDLAFRSWGFGVEGLSATVQLRGREEIGDEFVWPRADDPFDLIVGYAQLNEDVFRIRLGRQRTRSGLGFDSFDGLDVLAEPTPWLRVEAFGGRSLARGLHETRHEALAGVEDFLLDRDAYLLGAEAAVEPEPTTSLVVRYQREIWDNRAALVSERASADFETGLLRPVRISGSLDYDFAMGRVGKAHLTARLPLLDGRLLLEGTGRRYVPYFELWTIWGLFNPVAYHEGRLRATWSATPRLAVWGEAGYRAFDDTDTSPIFGPLEDDAYRVGGGARWEATRSVRVSGSYRMERGAGAFLSSGDVSARWTLRDDLTVGVHATAAQQIEEFRLGEGVVAGGGVTGLWQLSDRLQLNGGAAVYRRLFENRPAQVDWNQVRAWTSLRVRLGGDPGLAGRTR